MATRRKTPKAAPLAAPPNKGSIQPHQMLLSPSVQGAVGIHAWSKFMGEADLLSLVEDLREQVRDVQRGELGRVEAMLFSQATTLQTIFTSLARRAASNDGLQQFQVNLTLALKAQSQCRATLEALAEIKNPRPVMFAKQANVTSGPQQVNNGVAAPAPTNGQDGKTISNSGSQALLSEAVQPTLNDNPNRIALNDSIVPR